MCGGDDAPAVSGTIHGKTTSNSGKSTATIALRAQGAGGSV
jgi:hypothetical protein